MTEEGNTDTPILCELCVTKGGATASAACWLFSSLSLSFTVTSCRDAMSSLTSEARPERDLTMGGGGGGGGRTGALDIIGLVCASSGTEQGDRDGSDL